MPLLDEAAHYGDEKQRRCVTCCQGEKKPHYGCPGVKNGSVGNVGKVGNVRNIGTVRSAGNFGSVGNIGNVGSVGNLSNFGSVRTVGNTGGVGNVGNVGNFRNGRKVGSVRTVRKIGSIGNAGGVGSVRSVGNIGNARRTVTERPRSTISPTNFPLLLPRKLEDSQTFSLSFPSLNVTSSTLRKVFSPLFAASQRASALEGIQKPGRL